MACKHTGRKYTPPYNWTTQWCPKCGAFMTRTGWQLPKISETLIPLNEKDVAYFYDEFYEEASNDGIFNVNKFSKLLCARFGIPSANVVEKE